MRESRQPPSFINWSPGDRNVFRALLCLSCFSFVLPSKSFCVYPAFFPCYLQNSLVFILSFFRVVFGAFLCLFRFFPYCTANRLVLLLPFFRVTFGILLYLFCLSLELLSEPFCVCIAFALCLFYFCLFFVLFSNCISVSSVYFLYNPEVCLLLLVLKVRVGQTVFCYNLC